MDAQRYEHSADPAQGRTGHESGLAERDREILAFERQWWKYAGATEALEADPMLVKRLRRLRSARQRARSARRLGINV